VEKQVSSHGNVPDLNSRMEVTETLPILNTGKLSLSVLVLHTNDSVSEICYIQTNLKKKAKMSKQPHWMNANTQS